MEKHYIQEFKEFYKFYKIMDKYLNNKLKFNNNNNNKVKVKIMQIMSNKIKKTNFKSIEN